MSITFGEAFAAAEEARDFPEAWYPEEPGDTIAGVLVRFDITPKGNRLAVIRTEEPDEERAVFLTNVALVSAFERLDPQTGERVGVRFTGFKKSKSGRDYKSFLVVMPDRETEPGQGGGASGTLPLRGNN